MKEQLSWCVWGGAYDKRKDLFMNIEDIKWWDMEFMN